MTALEFLEDARRREKARTLAWRALAADAEAAGDVRASERLNGLHADEQHHLSRLTARVLELGGAPTDLRDVPRVEVDFDTWELTGRDGEAAEVAYYEAALDLDLDADTASIVREILESERKHLEHLGGKWMSA